LEETQEQALRDLALRAFGAIGASGWGRVDMLMNGQGQPFLIEANTVPGMTGHSLVPMAAKAAGMTFDELVWRILALTLAAC
jgi:D-alanine-D-alanine ligase